MGREEARDEWAGDADDGHVDRIEIVRGQRSVIAK